MPPEWPPKKLEPTPKPSGPDPEAVRRALAGIEGREAEHRRLYERHTFERWMNEVFDNHRPIHAAARAWLKQQDGETSE